MLKFKVVGLDEIERKTGHAVARFPDHLFRLMGQATLLVRRRVPYYLTGGKTYQSGTRAPNEGLSEASGALLKGIRESKEKTSHGAIGRVFDGTDTQHGRYWELDSQFPGGVRIIRPVRARVLAFEIRGQTVFTHRVEQKGPRKFLAPALRDEQDNITKLYAEQMAYVLIHGRTQ